MRPGQRLFGELPRRLGVRAVAGGSLLSGSTRFLKIAGKICDKRGSRGCQTFVERANSIKRGGSGNFPLQHCETGRDSGVRHRNGWQHPMQQRYGGSADNAAGHACQQQRSKRAGARHRADDRGSWRYRGRLIWGRHCGS